MFIPGHAFLWQFEAAIAGSVNWASAKHRLKTEYRIGINGDVTSKYWKICILADYGKESEYRFVTY